MIVDEKLISIVIPIYNSATFLEKTLDSLLNQSYRNIEFIIVDDGSTDNSTVILQHYLTKDNRIVVITKNNTGAGDSRNVGLERSRGEYIIFLDSDDIFDPFLLEKLYQQIELSQSDICLCNYTAVDGLDVVFSMQIPNITNPFNPADEYHHLFQITHPIVWNKLYRTQFIKNNNLKFSTSPSVNDLFFVYSSMFLAKKVTFIDEVLIEYNVANENSITKLSTDKWKCIFSAYNELFYALQRENLLNELIISFSMSFKETYLYYLDLKTVHNNMSINTSMNLFIYTKEWEQLKIKYRQELYFIEAMAQNLPIISIIMPIYNSEQYLRKSLDSLTSQTLYNIEIICINDGSHDGSLDILTEYANNDTRVKVFSQENAGPACARNVGLSHVTSPYLMFCDSDDWYEPGMCAKMLQTITRNQVDFVMCDANIFEEDHNHYRSQETIEYHHSKLHGEITLTDDIKPQITVLLWNKIFKMDFVRQYQITFPTGYEHDDAAFIWQYLAVSSAAIGLDDKLYNYLLRGDSIMGKVYSNKNKHKIYDVLYALEYAVNFINHYNLLDNNRFIISKIYDQTKWFSGLLDYPDKLIFVEKLKKHVLDKIPNTLIYNNRFLKTCKKGKFKKSVEILTGIKQYAFRGIVFFEKKTIQNKKTVYSLLGLSIYKKISKKTKNKYYVLGINVYSRRKSLFQYMDDKVSILLQDTQNKVSYLDDKWESDLSCLVNQSKENFKKVELLYNSFSNRLLGSLSHLNNEMDNISIQMKGKSYLYNNQFEKKYIEQHYYNFNARDPRIYTLLKGLDSHSASVIIKIIKRIERLKESGYSDLDLFDTSEIEALQKLANDFYSKILCISSDLYAYNNYFLPCNHFEASVFYNEGCLEFIQRSKQVVGKDIIDVGGFIGDSALVFQKLWPHKIYSFEANPNNVKLMQQTLRLNEIHNVEVVNLALGDQSGDVLISDESSCSKYIADNNQSGIKTRMVTLDEYVQDNNINNIGLIKVDIEGFEKQFIYGAMNTIKTQLPILLISIYHSWDDFLDIKPLLESWNLGYTFKIVKPIDKSLVLETLLICEKKIYN